MMSVPWEIQIQIVRQLLTFAFLKNQTELEYLLGMVNVQFNVRSRLVGF